MNSRCAKLMEEFYVRLRGESKKSSGLNVVVRHLESLIRMATACAKLHLRNEVSIKDCKIAIQILLESFISSQKPSIAENIKMKFQNYLNNDQTISSKLSFILNNMVNQYVELENFKNKNKKKLEDKTRIFIPVEEFRSRAKEN